MTSLISKEKCAICGSKTKSARYREEINYYCDHNTKLIAYYEYYLVCNTQDVEQFVFIILGNNRYGLLINNKINKYNKDSFFKMVI